MVSLRTIFLLIRGEYMAGAALRIAKKDIESLTKAEQQNIRASQQMAHYALFAGGAMVAFGGMIMMSLMKMMEKYGAASQTMNKFNRVMNRAMGNLAKGLIPVVEAMIPFINALAKILEIPFVAQMVGWGVVLMIVVGGFLLLGGMALQLVQFLGLLIGNTAMATLGTSLLGKSAVATSGHMYTYVAATNTLTISTKTATVATHGLAVAIGVALSGFILAVSIVTTVANVFGKTTGIIVGITIAIIGLAVAIMALKGVLSVGVTLAGDIAVFGAALAAGGALSAAYVGATYQKGTSFVRQGGLAIVHGGEEIKSARESTGVSKIEKERRFERTTGFPRTTWNVPITIENVHTKADKDTLGEELRRALKKTLDRKV